jgi:hypothetical protein
MNTFGKILSAAGCALVLLSGGAAAAMSESPLSCELKMRKSAAAPGRFQFILQWNRNDLKIYEDNNSWGYETRSFKARRKGDSQTYLISRTPRGWRANAPITTTLNKGDALVTDIDLCNGEWNVTPALKGKKELEILTLRGFFKIAPGDDPSRDGVWTGEVASGNTVDVSLPRACVKKLGS